MQFIGMQKHTNELKDYDKNQESPHLKKWDVINVYGWAML